MNESFNAIDVFCCYSHADEIWLRKVENHLSLLKRQGLISLWHDRLITPGVNRAQAIDAHLKTASVILLFVSADLFASDFCYGTEIQYAMARQKAGEARVIPILVRATDWNNAPFSHLQALPTNAQPLATWLDEDTALTDIAAGIRRAITEELPLLAARIPHSALPAIWNVPYPRNPFFLGRDKELKQLHHSLHTNQALEYSQPQAISGLGGIGKTQLALEYAYQHSREYQAVLWVNAESTEILISSYIALATLLHLPELEAKEQDVIIQAVKRWLQTHRSWLLILDNADELALLPAFLPPNWGGHLLLTTRASATGRLASRLAIEMLSPEQGALLLLRRAGFLAPDGVLEQVVSQEQNLALLICKELGGLPLALDQAGAYLEETETDLAGYWHIYQQHRTTLFQEHRGLAADYPTSVAMTWSISFQKVEKKNPAAADLLRLCAFLAPDAIPEEILVQGSTMLGPMLEPVVTDAFLLSQTIEAVRAYSLMRRNPREKTISIHRLVQAVLQDSMKKAERGLWAERAILAINATFPNVKHAVWAQCERLLPQVLGAIDLIEQYNITNVEIGRLLCESATYLNSRARYQEAERLHLQALQIRKQGLGPEHLDTAISLNGLAVFYYAQSKYMEAELLFHQALHIRKLHLGLDHPDTATSLSGLANLYHAQGKYTEAEPLYQQALHIREQSLALEHPDTAYSLNNLANLYLMQGKYTEAEPLFQQALHIREQLLRPEHADVAASLNNLANLYFMQGKYTEAEPLYHRALHIREQCLGLDHPLVAASLNNLANLYREQGKYTEAEPLHHRALHIREQHLGFDHPLVATSLNNLANLYREQGKYAEAEPLYLRALHIRRQRLGSRTLRCDHSLTNLANFYREQGKYTEREPLYHMHYISESNISG